MSSQREHLSNLLDRFAHLDTLAVRMGLPFGRIMLTPILSTLIKLYGRQGFFQPNKGTKIYAGILMGFKEVKRAKQLRPRTEPNVPAFESGCKRKVKVEKRALDETGALL